MVVACEIVHGAEECEKRVECEPKGPIPILSRSSSILLIKRLMVITPAKKKKRGSRKNQEPAWPSLLWTQQPRTCLFCQSRGSPSQRTYFRILFVPFVTPEQRVPRMAGGSFFHHIEMLGGTCSKCPRRRGSSPIACPSAKRDKRRRSSPVRKGCAVKAVPLNGNEVH